MSRTTSRVAGMLLSTGGLLLGLTTPSWSGGFYSDSPDPWPTSSPIVTIDPRYVLPKLSTLGEGVEYRLRHSARYNVRLEWFEYDQSRNDSNQVVQSYTHAKLGSRSLLLDWFPFEGRFRATAGIYFLNSDVSGSALVDLNEDLSSRTLSAPEVNQLALDAAQKLKSSGYAVYAAQLESFAAVNNRSMSISDSSYSSGTLAGASGRLDCRSYAPYIGVGWANAIGRRDGWFYSVDVGVMYLGRPDVEYSLDGPLADAMRDFYGADFTARVEQQERDTEDRLAKYRHYPVVSLGFWYAF